MNRTHFHLLEKFQVQITTALVVVAVYFLAWPLLCPPDAARALLLFENPGSLVTFSLLLLGLAIICSVITIPARPEGGLLAALLGAAGLSMRSAQVRTVLWDNPQQPGEFMSRFAMELLLLAVVVVLAAIMVSVVRGLVTRLRPGWRWRGLMDALSDEELSAAGALPPVLLMQNDELFGLEYFGIRLPKQLRQPPSRHARSNLSIKELMPNALSCLLMATAFASALLLLLMRSPQRGQIVLALFISFLAAMFIAQWKFATPVSFVALLSPVIVGLAFYCLGAVAAVSGEHLSWTLIPLYARALPIDWITAGCGGSVAGYWLGVRYHESQVLEKLRNQNG